MKRQIYKHHVLIILVSVATCIFNAACNKANDYLNVKRLNTDVVPSTLNDFQALLDNNNYSMNSNYPSIGLEGTDNLYNTTAVISAATLVERNSYIWAKDIYQGGTANDWAAAYKNVEYANVVLDGLTKISSTPANIGSYNNVMGSALFYRSISFYYLAQLYCKPYNAATASTDLGISLRLTSDVNVPSVRATVQATYNQIINDLKTAIGLLPVKPLFYSRPSQIAANALLAKTYLNMDDYTNAGIYANNSLSLFNTLLDYNNTALVSPTSTYHFPSFTTGNPEVSFYASGGGYSTLWANGKGSVDTNLYKMYSVNDLRQTLFYKKNSSTGLYGLFGTYAPGYDFSGIATDEVYLIRAECYARAGNAMAAMSDLNTLLVKRWKTGTFVPYTAVSSADALNKILTERRKELPFTGLVRWEDLRRLNTDPNFAVTVAHVYNGTVYTLPPNDPRYVYPIPDLEVQLYGLQQNSR